MCQKFHFYANCVHFGHRCFPSKVPFFVGLLPPVVLLYLFNLIMLVVIFATMQRDHKGEGSRREKLTYTVAFLLAVMFGVGWIFGVLGLPGNVGRGASITFQIFFILIIGGHGILLFFLLTFRSEDARYEWKRWYYYITCRPRLFHQKVFNSNDRLNRANQPNNATESLAVKYSRKGSFVAWVKDKFGYQTHGTEKRHDGSTTIENPTTLETAHEQNALWTRVQGIATDEADQGSNQVPSRAQQQPHSTPPTSDLHTPYETDKLDRLDDFSLSVNEALKMTPQLRFMPFTLSDDDSSFASESPTTSDHNVADTWPYNDQLTAFSTFKPQEENRTENVEEPTRVPRAGKSEPKTSSQPEEVNISSKKPKSAKVNVSTKRKSKPKSASKPEEVNVNAKPKSMPIYENVWPHAAHYQATSFKPPDQADSQGSESKLTKPQPTPRSAIASAIEKPEVEVRSGKALPSNFNPFQV